MITDSEQYWNTIHSVEEVYGQNHSVAVNLAITLLKKSKKIKDNWTFLELGCGYGRDFPFVYNQIPKVNYYGLDISINAIKRAKKRYNYEIGLNKVSFVASDCFTELLRFNTFDANKTIIYGHYFLHLFEPRNQEEILDALDAKFTKGAIIILSNYSSRNKRIQHSLSDEPSSKGLLPPLPKHDIFPFNDWTINFINKKYGWNLLFNQEYTEIEIVNNISFGSDSILTVYEMQ